MINTSAALRYFATTDPAMELRIDHALAATPPLALPQPKKEDQYFSTLVRCIVSQQISTKAAAAIYRTLQQQYTLTPDHIVTLQPESLQECGLTKQKSRYVISLAQNWSVLETSSFTTLSDDEITKRLVNCYGIGPWTAQMFLLFALARPDVFAIGDLGLRQQIACWYELEQSDTARIAEIADNWAPYRSLASLTLWYYIDNGPVLL